MKRPYSPGRLRVRFGVTRGLIGVMSALDTHRYAVARQLMHRVTQPLPALDLDHLRTRLHQLRRAVQGLLWRGAGHERKVSDDEATVVSALYAGRVINHIFQFDRQGAVIALQNHP